MNANLPSDPGWRKNNPFPVSGLVPYLPKYEK